MKEVMSRYNLLDKEDQKEVIDFLDFLLYKKSKEAKFDLDGYKRKIMNISVWSEADMLTFDENAKLLNQWQIEKW